MSDKHRKVRIDQLLVQLGLAESRPRAQALVMAGKVIVGDRRVDKPGQKVAEGSEVRLKAPDHPYVSRGGVKLEHALRELGVDVSGKRCLDLGASTGGFTDCLLQNGAREVVAVDVGYGQLHPKLRVDSRVVVMERTNARELEPSHLGGALADVVVVDCSFISLELLLPAIRRCLRPGGDMVALVKPQFEAGRKEVGKGGVVRDPAVREAALGKVERAVLAAGLTVEGVVESPLTGPAGNVEYLLHGARRAEGKEPS